MRKPKFYARRSGPLLPPPAPGAGHALWPPRAVRDAREAKARVREDVVRENTMRDMVMAECRGCTLSHEAYTILLDVARNYMVCTHDTATAMMACGNQRQPGATQLALAGELTTGTSFLAHKLSEGERDAPWLFDLNSKEGKARVAAENRYLAHFGAERAATLGSGPHAAVHASAPVRYHCNGTRCALCPAAKRRVVASASMAVGGSVLYVDRDHGRFLRSASPLVPRPSADLLHLLAFLSGRGVLPTLDDVERITSAETARSNLNSPRFGGDVAAQVRSLIAGDVAALQAGAKIGLVWSACVVDDCPVAGHEHVTRAKKAACGNLLHSGLDPKHFLIEGADGELTEGAPIVMRDDPLVEDDPRARPRELVLGHNLLRMMSLSGPLKHATIERDFPVACGASVATVLECLAGLCRAGHVECTVEDEASGLAEVVYASKYAAVAMGEGCECSPPWPSGECGAGPGNPCMHDDEFLDPTVCEQDLIDEEVGYAVEMYLTCHGDAAAEWRAVADVVAWVQAEAPREQVADTVCDGLSCADDERLPDLVRAALLEAVEGGLAETKDGMFKCTAADGGWGEVVEAFDDGVVVDDVCTAHDFHELMTAPMFEG